ncbi:LysR family transcriptional regulator [Pseudorhodoferax sp.]|uniref:LysR family transcriptional regulator n=1 Tax=Pseudorhodoferax sp. TaxID=1993553 RepID=UPI002DD6350B|nr:LysR family transcriptional regulator [Pseudorhodoferax sp.]
MDRLSCLQVFAEVARANSFTVAAHRLSMSRASVSKHIAQLERALGAQLLQRTTKQVGLTDAGLRVLENGALLLERYEEIAADVRDTVTQPRGVVRVSAPQSFCTHQLLPLVSDFSRRHPDIQVALSIDDGRSALVSDGLDVMVRIASALEDASHVALPLLTAPQVLVGSPDYLRRAGMPRSLRDLARHNCLVHTIKSPTGIWRFGGSAADEIAVRVRGSLCANFGDVLHQAALRGAGLSMHPAYMVEDDLRAGRLLQVLPETPPRPLDVVALYSSRRHLPSRVRLLLDHLQRWARTPPPWAAPYRPAPSPPVLTAPGSPRPPPAHGP